MRSTDTSSIADPIKEKYNPVAIRRIAAIFLIGTLLIRSSYWPSWLGYFGLIVAAALLLNLLEMIGVDMGAMITISETLQHFWMLATAIVFLRKKRNKQYKL